MPQNPYVVATKSPSSDVYVFDVSKHPSIPDGVAFQPQHVCTGHEREGYGLFWNPHRAGHLLSGSDDAKICLWDINCAGKCVRPISVWKGHIDVVEDVAWHSFCPNVFGSVGDDRKVLMWDTRHGKCGCPSIEIGGAHAGDVNTLSFNPAHEFVLATGSADTSVKLWDFRNTSRSVHTFNGHDNEVFQVSWAPFESSVLASCGADRRIYIWDLGKIGASMSTNCSQVPAEQVFIHGGHTGTVSELSWNMSDCWSIASVAEDNILQVWKPVQEVCGLH